MGDFILGGFLIWLTVFVWWGTNLVLRDGRRERVVGGLLIAVAPVPSLIALWLSAWKWLLCANATLVHPIGSDRGWGRGPL